MGNYQGQKPGHSPASPQGVGGRFAFMPYKRNGKCVVKADTGETVKCHDTEAETEAHMKALMANVPDSEKYQGARHSSGDRADMQAIHDIAVKQGAMCGEKEKMTASIDCFLIENYVATRPGEPYLWLPYGTIRKGDNTREVTPELASRFRLPHFKPPIKLGSHEESTPAGGHIARFELRDDGVWVFPELVPNGERALSDGAYRYHSPEIIWPDGYLQNPDTGEYMPGPFIMGDALLHTPHLGEKAALYSIERTTNMPDNTVTVPASLWEKMSAMLDKLINPPPAETPEVTKLKAEAARVEQLTAEINTLKAQTTRAQELSAMVAELQNKESYGVLFADASVAMTAAEHFTAMPKEAREWSQKTIRALSAQVDESALLKKYGQKAKNGGATTATEQFNAEVMRVATEKKLSYQDAVKAVSAENPDLYRAWKEE